MIDQTNIWINFTITAHCSASALDHISFGQTFLARDMGDNDYT